MDKCMLVGLGDEHESSAVNIAVYIANRPPMEPYQSLEGLQSLQSGEIAAIAKHTGNHWRKVFNVYAKLMYAFLQKAQASQTALPQLTSHFAFLSTCASWQAYRDRVLLQSGSHTRLLFTEVEHDKPNTLHIVMGKGHGQTLGYQYDPAHLVDDEHGDFACYDKQAVILCPYFDYRQLSNIKIDRLVDIMLDLMKTDFQ